MSFPTKQIIVHTIPFITIIHSNFSIAIFSLEGSQGFIPTLGSRPLGEVSLGGYTWEASPLELFSIHSMYSVFDCCAVPPDACSGCLVCVLLGPLPSLEG